MKKFFLFFMFMVLLISCKTSSNPIKAKKPLYMEYSCAVEDGLNKNMVLTKLSTKALDVISKYVFGINFEYSNDVIKTLLENTLTQEFYEKTKVQRDILDIGGKSYYIEYGNNSPLFNYEGVRPVGVTRDWLNDTDYIKKRMRELLSNYGYII